MSYDEKFERVKTSLTECIVYKITSRYNYCDEFEMWSYSEIIEAYRSKFSNEFSQHMTERVVDMLFVAAKNFTFAVRTFVELNPNYSLNKLLRFVNTFVSTQLDDFDNWCDDIMMAMGDDEDEEETQDNPV